MITEDVLILSRIAYYTRYFNTIKFNRKHVEIHDFDYDIIWNTMFSRGEFSDKFLRCKRNMTVRLTDPNKTL